MADYISTIGRGTCEDHHPFVPGINCMECGRFVGRDGSIEIEHFEMSGEVASVEGTCSACIATYAR